MYANRIDVARKAVAIAMAVCGLGLVVCIRQDDYLTGTLRREPGMWRWGIWAFGIGVAACLTATFAFVIEYLARPTAPTVFTLRVLFVRSLLIFVVIAAISFSMTLGFGAAQGVGAAIGAILLLAAIRERRAARAILAVLAVVVLGPTLLSTQSAYQYARRNASEIVAAGCELMGQWPKTQFDQEVQIDDPRVPKTFHSLGVRRVWIEEDCVSVLVPGLLGLSDREFVICRDPHPATIANSVWMQRKGFSKACATVRINDQLRMTDY
jgi:hypothetical protein